MVEFRISEGRFIGDNENGLRKLAFLSEQSRNQYIND